MSQQDAFDDIVASLHEATLDDAHWLPTSALIDDACRIKGNTLAIAGGRAQRDIEIYYTRLCIRGERHEELERRYVKQYFLRDERMPRLRRLPDSHVAYVPDLYTEQERRTSPAYNEALHIADSQKGLNVRLDGPSGSRITWNAFDTVDGEGWSAAQLELIRRLLPHLRQYVRVRHVLAEAGALGASLTELLDITGAAFIHLGPRGRIVAANDRALELLRQGDGLFDSGGFLCARSTPENTNLQELLKRALPRSGGQGTGGSMTVRRFSHLSRFALHISPVDRREMDSFAWRVAALAVVVDPGSRACIDPALAEASLDLTPTESQVAVWLAEGRTVRDIAAATGRKESTIRWHLRNIFNKHGISRQSALVQLIWSLASTPHPGQRNH